MSEVRGPRDSVIAGLDIGTSKVACVVGERNSFGGVDVIGIGSHPSRGLRKGVVINIEDTVKSISAAVEEAEMMAGVEVNSVYTNIAGGHIRSLNSEGMVPIRSGEVAQSARRLLRGQRERARLQQRDERGDAVRLSHRVLPTECELAGLVELPGQVSWLQTAGQSGGKLTTVSVTPANGAVALE